MKTDSLGIPRFSNKDLIDMIYTGHAEKCYVVLCDPSDDIDQFNKVSQEQGLPTLTKYIPIDVEQKDFDEALQSDWFMPEKYKKLDIYNYILDKCPDEPKEMARVCEEMHEYEKRGLFNLLRFLVYLIDVMRENNMVWGVGRGSSVASYVLYLIGVHKINSIQYQLSWQEFMR
jgi:DNA polymerase III alpha subunit